MDNEGNLLATGSEDEVLLTETEEQADVAQEAEPATATDEVVDAWFLTFKGKLSRDTATRNTIYRGLSDLKTALNEVKA